MKNVNHARNAGIYAKCNQPLTGLVDNAFVIDQSNVLRQYGVQQRHICGLRFDCVRKEAIGFVGKQRIDGHLFNAKYDGGLA